METVMCNTVVATLNDIELHYKQDGEVFSFSIGDEEDDFAIDSDDVELSFRLANNVDGGVINESIVRTCFLQVMYRLRNSYEEIMKAMYGGEQFTFTFADSSKNRLDA